MSKDRRAPVALCEKRIPLTMPRSLYEGIVIAAAEDLKSVNGLIRDTMIANLRKRGVPIGKAA